MNFLRKEQIKDRMVQTAAKFWDVPENQIEKNFDPLVALLFDTIAAELEQTGYQINAMRDRLLDHLTEKMLPDAILKARPSTCVLQTMPNETETVLSDKISFKTSVKIHKTGEPVKEKEIYFTPIGSFLIFKAKLSHLLIGNRLMSNTGNGIFNAISEDNHSSLVNEIHLAIATDSSIQNLKGLSLFFDLAGHSESDNFYFSLASATGYCNGQMVKLQSGYYNQDQFDLQIKDTINHVENNYTRKIQREIAGIYQHHFVHLPEDIPVGQANIPEEWKKNAPEKLIQEFQMNNYVFLTIKLNHFFEREVLSRIQYGINAFPAINRSLKKLNYQTEKWVNIIPLPTEDIFFDLQQISSINGSIYEQVSEEDKGEIGTGRVVLRNAALGNLGSRNVEVMVGQLMDAVRDQSAYFDKVGNDFVTSSLKEITRIITRLEDKIHSSNHLRQSFQYLLLKPKSEGDIISINYWETDPEASKSLKSNTPFRSNNHAETDPFETFTLTNATGGFAAPNEISKQNSLALHLASGGKVVSEDDVKRLCFQIFGDRLDHVAIRKIARPSVWNKKGIQRSVEIELSFKAENYDLDLLEYQKRQLMYLLDKNANMILPFYVSINKTT